MFLKKILNWVTKILDNILYWDCNLLSKLTKYSLDAFAMRWKPPGRQHMDSNVKQKVQNCRRIHVGTYVTYNLFKIL